jgi:hypothetical protein
MIVLRQEFLLVPYWITLFVSFDSSSDYMNTP